MSNAKYTKGQWYINKTGAHHNNPSLENIEICYSDIGECICDTVYEEADAHLIAAAPEMYAMLNKFLKLVADDSSEDFLIDYQAIKALLAKARGE